MTFFLLFVLVSKRVGFFFFLTGFQKGLEFCVYIHTLALTITLLWKWVHCALTSHLKVDVAVLIFFHLM